jgi:hypothetical protein
MLVVVRTARVAAGLLGLLAIAGCRACSGAPATKAAAPASTPSARALPWLAEADRLYKSALADKAPARPPFGRIRGTLTITDADPVLVECPEEERRCKLEGDLYVRAERVDGGLSILPQCSVLAYDGVLAPAARRGPWQVVSGALASGSAAKLRGRAGAVWTWNVERWTDPAPLPARARDAWVYTRSLVVAHAKTYGIALDVDTGTYERPEAFGPAERDAYHATRGSPLAMLMDPALPLPLNGEPGMMTREPDFWVRERVLAPVRPGEVGGFVGRVSQDELRVTCAQIEQRMRPFATALLANGLDIVRFALGAVLTDGDLYYPQVSLRWLAQVLDCLAFGPVVAPALRELATMPSLDWQNRFRAGCVSRLLDGRPCDLDLLRESLGPDADAGAGLDGLDGVCIEGLMGQWKLGG